MAFKLLSVFALVCLAAVLVHAEEQQPQPHLLAKRSDSKWFKHPGSPTARKTVKDDAGQQIDYTQNDLTGHQTNGYLANSDNARQSPEHRFAGQKGSGPAGTSKPSKGKGKKGH